MTEPQLVVTDAKISYGDLHALSGVSLELYPGELLLLLGPNGAGKTSLIRCICGRQQLDAGQILIGGAPLSGSGQSAMRGMVPQEIALYPDLTAEQNLKVFGQFHGVSGSLLKERIEEALSWTRLESRRRDLVGKFSGGMQRRLNIACGVLHHPEVILLDEPTVGVDPQSRELIFEMLNDLKSKGAAILLTTHQLDEAESRGDRVIVIDHGRVIANGTVEQLIRETVGEHQQLTVELAPRSANDEAEYLSRQISRAAEELTDVLTEVESEGREVKQLTLKSATLQDVFLKLTGRELRE